jgi:hypothetical protein
VVCFLPTDFAWRDTLIDSVRTMAGRCELDKEATKDLELAADDVWSFIAKRRSDKNEVCEVLLLGGKRHMVMGFSLPNRMIVEEDGPQYSLLVGSLSERADDVLVKSIVPEGQVIRISRTGSEGESAAKK